MIASTNAPSAKAHAFSPSSSPLVSQALEILIPRIENSYRSSTPLCGLRWVVRCDLMLLIRRIYAANAEVRSMQRPGCTCPCAKRVVRPLVRFLCTSSVPAVLLEPPNLFVQDLDVYKTMRWSDSAVPAITALLSPTHSAAPLKLTFSPGSDPRVPRFRIPAQGTSKQSTSATHASQLINIAHH